MRLAAKRASVGAAKEAELALHLADEPERQPLLLPPCVPANGAVDTDAGQGGRPVQIGFGKGHWFSPRSLHGTGIPIGETGRTGKQNVRLILL